MVPIEQKDGTSRYHFPHGDKIREAEAPILSATITVMKKISFRSILLQRPGQGLVVRWGWDVGQEPHRISATPRCAFGP